MAAQDIRQLFTKYMDGTISQTEYRALLHYFALPEHADDVDELLYRAIAKESGEASVSEKELEEVLDAAYQKVQRRIIGHTRKVWRLLPYAAAILIAATAATWIFFGDQINLKSGIATIPSEDIGPGGNRATLTLADGRTIDLSEAQTGIVVGDGITYSDGSEVVNVGKESLMSDVSHLMSVSTPMGGQYQVTLPDGSKVWLNAASTLKYPNRFSDEERVVELIGEAYFEVRHETPDSAPESHLKSDISYLTSHGRPFRVLSKGQRVEVLGTEFNISAYADEPETKTTLVEGSVKVSNLTSQISKLLNPGEQGVSTANGITKHQVDIAPIIAWQKGYFRFSETLESVMKQVARWYAVEVIFKDETLKTMGVMGSVNRNRPLSELLILLEETTGAKFAVAKEERRVEVMR